MLREVCSIDLSLREEVLFAAAYIEEAVVPAEYFPESTYERFVAVAEFLKSVPRAWAEEICIETLMNAREQR